MRDSPPRTADRLVGWIGGVRLAVTGPSVGVYRQYVGYARDFGVRVHVIANKIDDESVLAFLREPVGVDLLTWVGRSGFVRAAERGTPRPIAELEAPNRQALRAIQAAVDGCVKDPRYTAQAVEFHLRNAQAWGNDRTGEDFAAQVDPAFVLGPHRLVLAQQH